MPSYVCHRGFYFVDIIHSIKLFRCYSSYVDFIETSSRYYILIDDSQYEWANVRGTYTYE